MIWIAYIFVVSALAVTCLGVIVWDVADRGRKNDAR